MSDFDFSSVKQEFTPEQIAEIEKQVEKVRQETARFQQWVIAGDQFFREALLAVNEKVNLQMYDPYVLEVGTQMYKSFREQNLGPQHNGSKHETKQS